MAEHFTHLHLHTDHSLLDGAITVDKLVDFGQKNQFKALAITDHGNIFGAVKFFQKCKKAKIKPILGMEAYFTEDISIKSVEKKYYHLVLLVQNSIGYKNLCKLISYAYQEGFYFKPRIDYAALEKHSEGLIATTACLGGHIPSLLMNNQEDLARERIGWFLNIFGPDRFFLEVQPPDQQEQLILNQKLFALHKELGVKCVATGDCHYVAAEDREAHEVMLAIQTQAKMSDPNRYTFGDCRVHMRTTQEMLEIFPDYPDAIWNSGVIADSCNFDFETGKLFFPKFEVPVEHTAESYFKELCQIGLNRLFDQGLINCPDKKIYQDRLDLEMNLIINMGFVGYFLVVSDFIQWAYRQKIPVGPGRGSAAGSLVAWTLQITNIDPLKYNLLFERFLNPERVSMPDIDIDFCIEGREAVINYVRDKYGHDKVCQIITFGTMMAKGVLKDVARALGFPFEDSNALTNLIPDQLKITLHEALQQEPKLKELVEQNPKIAKLYEIALKLEGITRHASKHAAGIVISPEPISDVLPIYVPPKSTELVTQYAMTELESIGFLKMDLLGLKNLTLIARALAMIERNHGIVLDIDKLPLEDQKTFCLLGLGKTSGVFQLESDGLKEVLRKLQPEKFEDIIAVNALYRPGPLGSGMVDDFIERKHGRQKIAYIFPELEPILQETYGVIVYQEQVMKIASAIGGYSLGEADILRRAMGKKKAEVMAEQRAIFLERAHKQNFDGTKAGELFDLMAYFAGYGFNKSHSAAYALIAYQTAYLKAHFPAEFMAQLISLETSDPDKMTFYLQEAKDMKISLLPPDINKSLLHFDVVNNALLFGLQGIKNVGTTAIENIIHERTTHGAFKDMLDFCKRVDLRVCNKRVIESLISAGAFDSLPGNRAQKCAELSKIMEVALEKKKTEETGQLGLFESVALTNKDKSEQDFYAFQPLQDWSDKEKLEREKEVTGFYLSAHRLEGYKQLLSILSLTPFNDILARIGQGSSNSGSEIEVIACGLSQGHRAIVTKKGDKMAFLNLEDFSGTAEVILFPKVFAAVEQWLDSYHVFVVKGTIDQTSMQKCKIKANECIPLELVLHEWKTFDNATIILPPLFEEELIVSLKQSLLPGKVPLRFAFQEHGKHILLSTQQKIALGPDAVAAIEKLGVSLKIAL